MRKKLRVKSVVVYFGEDQHDQLKKLAEVRLTSVSGVLRQIISDYLTGDVK